MQPSHVKSAMRVLEILEFFKNVRQPRAMSEISAALGYPQSSTTVLLKTLIALGYLNFNRKERLYFPTVKVTSLGEWVPNTLFASGGIIDAMNDVHAETGESVSINTKNDIYVQYVQVLQSVHALRFQVNECELRPMTQSATGWLLMSTMSDKVLDNLIRRANIVTQKNGERVELPAMMEKIRTIRRQGYASAENIPFLGGATLCVLLPVTIQGQPVSLGLGGAAERIRQNSAHYLQVLQSAAKRLEPVEGFQTPIEIEL